MHIPRFRIRTMMIVVAVTAALSAGTAAIQRRAVRFQAWSAAQAVGQPHAATIQRRAARFQELSVLHQIEAGKVLLTDLEVYLLLTPFKISNDTPRREVEEILNRVQQEQREAAPMIELKRYHWALAEKYARAARRPWLAVAPDPPAPLAPSLEYQKAFRARYPDICKGTPVPPPIRTDLADEVEVGIPTIAL